MKKHKAALVVLRAVGALCCAAVAVYGFVVAGMFGADASLLVLSVFSLILAFLHIAVCLQARAGPATRAVFGAAFVVCFLGQLVAGLVLVNRLIFQDYGPPSISTRWKPTISSLYILSICISSILLPTVLMFLFEPTGVPDDEMRFDHDVDGTASYSPSCPSKDVESNGQLAFEQDTGFPKKLSERTLVEDPEKRPHSIACSSIEQANDDTKIAYVIETAHNKDDKDVLCNDENNWMNSALVLYQDESHLGHSHTSSSLSSAVSLKKALKKSNTQVFKSLLKLGDSQNNPMFPPAGIFATHDSFSIPNLSHRSSMDFNSKQYISGTLPSDNRVSLLLPKHRLSLDNLAFDNNVDLEVAKVRHNDKSLSRPSFDEKEVNRSKSMSCMRTHPGKVCSIDIKEKSINNERAYLSSISDTLLPPVLRKGESPILSIKRQQTQEKIFEHPETISREVYEQRNAMDHNDAPGSMTNNVSDLSNNAKLLKISEFGESVNEEFDNFNQSGIDTASDRDPVADNGHEENTGLGIEYPSLENYEDDEYSKSLKNLEKIPKLSAPSQKLWGQKSSDLSQKGSRSNLRHVSLEEWHENWDSWNEMRIRSGDSYNFPKILQKQDSFVSQMEAKEFGSLDYPGMIPEVKMNETYGGMVTQIDNLSELSSTIRPDHDTRGSRSSLAFLNRSYSAPSLHTFRNLSLSGSGLYSNSNTKYSGSESDKDLPELKVEHYHMDTLTPQAEVRNSTNSSPIKRFFQESPKKIGNVFRKRPRNSIDSLPFNDSYNYHRHAPSTVSYQQSAHSHKSSMGGASPKRKSLRSFLSIAPSNQSVPLNLVTTVLSLPFAPNELTHYDDIPQPLDYLHYFDQEDVTNSDKSRVSSVPSAVIGEYDREKWRTLKALQNQEKMCFPESTQCN